MQHSMRLSRSFRSRMTSQSNCKWPKDCCCSHVATISLSCCSRHDEINNMLYTYKNKTERYKKILHFSGSQFFKKTQPQKTLWTCFTIYSRYIIQQQRWIIHCKRVQDNMLRHLLCVWNVLKRTSITTMLSKKEEFFWSWIWIEYEKTLYNSSILIVKPGWNRKMMLSPTKKKTCMI